MRHAMRPLCLLLLVAAPVPAAAQSLDPEALKLISETAASICRATRASKARRRRSWGGSGASS